LQIPSPLSIAAVAFTLSKYRLYLLKPYMLLPSSAWVGARHLFPSISCFVNSESEEELIFPAYMSLGDESQSS
jgi:hypothetical protein